MAIDIIIRNYESKDQERVLALIPELDTELSKRFDINPSPEEGIKYYKEHYLRENTKYSTFIASKDEKIAGFIIGHPTVDMAEIDHLDVLPISSDWLPDDYYVAMTFVSQSYRNQGISKELKIKLVEYARECGHKEIWSYVGKWNEHSVKANRSLGFQEQEQDKRYRFSLKL
ncbi:GNAT family N-acetyltransferase [Candidatus Woesearchaeota archaeon]|nr:GNAT family N-acetyltransferase [Candidatus Woesearchaeota archaeon]